MKYENCRIRSVYKNLSNGLGKWLIQISYNEPNSIFTKFKDIKIDQEKFIDEFLNNNNKTLYYTNGMVDIDFNFLKDGKMGITYSAHEGSYIDFIFNKDEYEKLKNILKEYKN
jgi:hypothetical protein